MQSYTHLPSLIPLSRDHGIALFCAHYGRKAIRASKNDRLELTEMIRAICREQIDSNLEDEQWILSPVIGDATLRAEFHQRHRNIRSLITQLNSVEVFEDPGLGLLARIANALDDYVRWEENILYPRIVEGINRHQSDQLSRLTATMEASRNRPTQRLHSSIARKHSLSDLQSANSHYD